MQQHNAHRQQGHWKTTICGLLLGDSSSSGKGLPGHKRDKSTGTSEAVSVQGHHNIHRTPYTSYRTNRLGHHFMVSHRLEDRRLAGPSVGDRSECSRSCIAMDWPPGDWWEITIIGDIMGSQWYKVCMECVYENKYREHLQFVYGLTKNREPSISNDVLYEYLDCSPQVTTLVMVPFWHNSTNDSLKWYDPLSEMLWPLGMHKNIQYKSKWPKSVICTSDISRRKMNFTEQLTTGMDVSFSPGRRVSCSNALLAHIFDCFLTLYYIFMLYIYTCFILFPFGTSNAEKHGWKKIFLRQKSNCDQTCVAFFPPICKEETPWNSPKNGDDRVLHHVTAGTWADGKAHVAHDTGLIWEESLGEASGAWF